MEIFAGLASACAVFGAGMAGLYLFRWLPAHHRTAETRDVVRLGMNMISILAALALGLLIASAKGTFDRADQQLRDYAADITQLDQTLRRYGPETAPIRAELLHYSDFVVSTTWPEQGEADNHELESRDAGDSLDGVLGAILALPQHTEQQGWLRTRALDLASRIIHTRWMLLISQHGTLSPVLVVLVVSWIAFIFASFGLDAPRNATVVTALLVCSLSIGAAIYVILDMETPFDSPITVSGEPMKSALDHLRVP
jgi:hypothetical protein